MTTYTDSQLADAVLRATPWKPEDNDLLYAAAAHLRGLGERPAVPKILWGVVANARINARRAQQAAPLWSLVSRATGLGSTSSANLCRQFGANPDSTSSDEDKHDTATDQPAKDQPAVPRPRCPLCESGHYPGHSCEMAVAAMEAAKRNRPRRHTPTAPAIDAATDQPAAIEVNDPVCAHGKGFLERCPQCKANERWVSEADRNTADYQSAAATKDNAPSPRHEGADVVAAAGPARAAPTAPQPINLQPMQSTYYVRHPDDSYSVADPQPAAGAFDSTPLKCADGSAAADLARAALVAELHWYLHGDEAMQSHWANPLIQRALVQIIEDGKKLDGLTK